MMHLMQKLMELERAENVVEQERLEGVPVVYGESIQVREEKETAVSTN